MAQFFCGHDTLVCDAYGIKTTKQFINTLSLNIRKRGAMDTLISDDGDDDSTYHPEEDDNNDGQDDYDDVNPGPPDDPHE